jgi:hypothetical protein
MIASTTAMVVAFATWPEGNDPKSAFTRISSGRALPNRLLSSCTRPADSTVATAKYAAAQNLRNTHSAMMTSAGTTKTPSTPPPM